jgi:Concanavalin A-like lectin/glucanases superfamily
MRYCVEKSWYLSAAAFLFASLLTSAAPAVLPNPLESAYWRFEEGTAGGQVTPRNSDVVLDSINDNELRAFMDVTVDASPTYVATIADKPLKSGLSNGLALDFLPNQDLFSNEQDINNGIIAAGGGFTLEAAFRPIIDTSSPDAAFRTIVGKEGRPALGKGLGFIENLPTLALKVRGGGMADPARGRLQIELWDGGPATTPADNPQVSSLAPLMNGVWYYTAVVNDGSTLSLWLDRNDGLGYQLQGSTPLSGGALYQGDDPQNPDWDRPWTIGRGEFGGGPADFFNGIIDEVRLSNTALTPSQFLFAPPGEELEGDYNNNGSVDAADYVVWRQTMSSSQAAYNTWRTNFGRTAAPGLAAAAAVPEPASLGIAILGFAVGVVLRPSRSGGKYSRESVN